MALFTAILCHNPRYTSAEQKKYEQLRNLIAVCMRTKNIGIAGGVVRWWWWLWAGKKQRRKKKPSQRQRKRNERSGKWELAL